MKKILLILLMLIMIPLVIGISQFQTKYNIYTGKLDFVRSRNQSGSGQIADNYTADIFCLAGDCRTQWPSAGTTSAAGFFLISGSVISINKSATGGPDSLNASDFFDDSVNINTIYRTEAQVNSLIDNATVIRTSNTSWVTNLFSSGDGNLSYSNGVYTMSKLILGQFINNLNWVTDTVIQGWISTNKTDTETILRDNIDTNSTVNRAYTDTRVDSIDNHTKTGNETTRVDLIIDIYIPNNSTTDRAYSDSTLDNGSVIRSNNLSASEVDAIAFANNPNGTNFFATLNDLTGGNVTITETVIIRNDESVALSKGDPVYFTSYISGISKQGASFANNSDTSKHADCIVFEIIGAGNSGLCVETGHVTQADTSMWPFGSDLYLAQFGNLTNVRPAIAKCVQKVGMVLRSHASQGVIWVSGTDRCNDVPNSITITGNYTGNRFCNATNCYTVTDFLVDSIGAAVDWTKIQNYSGTGGFQGCEGDQVSNGRFQNGTFNCTTVSSTGDITDVSTNGPYLTGGAASGDVDLLYNGTYGNETINASIDVKVNVGFLQGFLDVVYAAITYVDERVNSIDNHTKTGNETTRVDLITGTYIPDNSTFNLAYTDIRVDSIDNHTKTGNCTVGDSCNTVLYKSGGTMTGEIDMSNINLVDINSTCYDSACTIYTQWNGSCLISHTPTTEIKQGSAC